MIFCLLLQFLIIPPKNSSLSSNGNLLGKTDQAMDPSPSFSLLFPSSTILLGPDLFILSLFLLLHLCALLWASFESVTCCPHSRILVYCIFHCTHTAMPSSPLLPCTAAPCLSCPVPVFAKLPIPIDSSFLIEYYNSRSLIALAVPFCHGSITILLQVLTYPCICQYAFGMFKMNLLCSGSTVNDPLRRGHETVIHTSKISIGIRIPSVEVLNCSHQISSGDSLVSIYAWRYLFSQ